MPGNKSLHQRLSEERATSREETLTHGTPVSSRGVTLSNATADSTPNAHTGPEHSPASSEESTSSFWCAEKRKSEFPEFEQTVRETKYSYETSENERDTSIIHAVSKYVCLVGLKIYVHQFA